MRPYWAAVVLLLVIVAWTPQLVAHHADVEYDVNKTVIVTGKLVKLEWQNPHTYAYVEISRADGSKAAWGGDTGPAHLHLSLGWTREGVMGLIGQTVTMSGHPAKNGAPHMGSAANLTSEKGAVLSVNIRAEKGSLIFDGAKVRAENGVVVKVKE